MAWGREKLTPDELKEAGLDPEVFKKLADKNTEFETTLTKLQKDQVDAFEGIKTSIAAMENKIKEFKSASTSNAGGGSNSNAGGNSGGDGGDSGKSEELDFLLDPEKSTRHVVNQAVTPLLSATAEMRAEMIYNRFSNQNKKGFRKYEGEIKEMWDKQNIVAKQNPELLENCYKIIVANHMDEIQKGGDSFFVESGSGGGGTPANMGGGEKKKATDVLTKDQLEICTKWGIDPEDYLKELNTTYA